MKGEYLSVCSVFSVVKKLKQRVKERKREREKERKERIAMKEKVTFTNTTGNNPDDSVDPVICVLFAIFRCVRCSQW